VQQIADSLEKLGLGQYARSEHRQETGWRFRFISACRYMSVVSPWRKSAVYAIGTNVERPEIHLTRLSLTPVRFSSKPFRLCILESVQVATAADRV
jgi:hypothetical protein